MVPVPICSTLRLSDTRPAPRRAVRPKTAAEKAFCALGPVAEAFITLGPELAELNTLAAAHGEQTFLAALGRGGRVRTVARQ